MRFNADGSEVVTASDDGTIRVWHAQPRELQTEFATSSYRGTPNPVDWAVVQHSTAAGYSPVDSYQACLPVHGQRQAAGRDQPRHHGGDIGWNNSGTEVVTAQPDGTVDVWHAVGSRYTQVPLRSPIHLNGSAIYTGHDSRRIPHRDSDL